MPTDSDDTQARTENLTIRVTPEERRKVLKVASIEDRTYADLLREMGLNGIVQKHDRMVSELAEASA